MVCARQTRRHAAPSHKPHFTFVLPMSMMRRLMPAILAYMRGAPVGAPPSSLMSHPFRHAVCPRVAARPDSTRELRLSFRRKQFLIGFVFDKAEFFRHCYRAKILLIGVPYRL